jgi:hypothetical protein
MKPLKKVILAVAGMLALGIIATKAQESDALLDALVKKGVLSDQEAEDIRADAAKSFAGTPAGKLAFSDSIVQIKFYGDARLRWEYLDETPQDRFLSAAYGHNTTTTDRLRYRIRVGSEITLTDKFKAGFELESATAGDSANQTFGNAYSKEPINVGLVYLEYDPTNWLTLQGGKFKNPLYTTDLMWDPDINPEGGNEQFNFKFPLDFGSTSTTTPSSDPKAMATTSSEPILPNASLSVGFTAAQLIYADNNEYTSPISGLTNRTDVWQFVEQVPIQFNFDKNTFVKVVPGFDSYMDGGNDSLSGSVTASTSTAIGGGSSVTFASPHAADDLQIFTAPGEVDWQVGTLPMKAYWDLAWNLDGKQRVQDVYFGNLPVSQGGAAVNANDTATKNQNRALGDNVAWLAGLQVGNAKKKGDWALKGDFRQTGLGSVDPNTNDSDFADSFLNQQGVKVQGTYMLTDFLSGSVTFYDTWAYKNNLLNGTAGQVPGGLPLAGGAGTGATVAGGTTSATADLVGIHTSQRVQVDMMWKF